MYRSVLQQSRMPLGFNAERGKLTSQADSGNQTANYDHFDYQLNITICNDATVCPKNFLSEADNTTCCDDHQGKPEIPFRNANAIPDDGSGITDYYSSAGKTIPTDGVYVTATYSTFTATTRSLGAAITTTTTNTTPSQTPTSLPASSSSSSDDDGLSAGAKAGIGIGAVIGAIIIALAAYFLWMRRRKAMRKSQLGGGDGATNGEYSGVPQEPTQGMYYKSEMPSDSQRIEMDTVSPSERMSRTHELPVSS
ncbi:MAG: hypothetical protein Q9220_006347 [cf. Caloplaca sp. 1 TL-2023]